MVTTWPKGFPGLAASAERLAKRITAMTEGQITVRVFAAGELVDDFECFDAVGGGDAEMYHAFESYWQSKSRAFNFFSAVPFGLTAAEIEAWVLYGGGQALWEELAKPFNVKPLLAGNTGAQMGGWYNKEIKGPDDFKGLKVRMPGLAGDVMRRLGSVAVNLPAGEIFPALRSGAIDGTEWGGPWNDVAFGLQNVAKFYYYPGFHEPGTAMSLGVNLKLWEGLSLAHKAAIEAAAAAECAHSLAEFNARNAEALEDLRGKFKVTIRKFEDSTLQAMGEASGQVVTVAGEGDALSRKIAQSFFAFRRQAISWSKIAEQAYFSARLLPFRYGT